VIGAALEAGDLHYFEPYEAVHRQNLEKVRFSGRGTKRGGDDTTPV
jgi:hypothetical protein